MQKTSTSPRLDLIIGKYVADMLEGKMPPGYKELWSWRFGQRPDDVSNPRLYPVRELTELSWVGEKASTRCCKIAVGV